MLLRPTNQGLHLTTDLFADSTDCTIYPTPKRSPTPHAGHLSLVQSHATIDEDEPNPLGSKFGFIECRSIPDFVGVEKD